MKKNTHGLEALNSVTTATPTSDTLIFGRDISHPYILQLLPWQLSVIKIKLSLLVIVSIFDLIDFELMILQVMVIYMR